MCSAKDNRAIHVHKGEECSAADYCVNCMPDEVRAKPKAV